MVEDHPVDYITFKGTIPEGNYGAGKVGIWDKGTYEPVNARHEVITERAALQALKKGELKVRLTGNKLKGEFVLVRLKADDKTGCSSNIATITPSMPSMMRKKKKERKVSLTKPLRPYGMAALKS